MAGLALRLIWAMVSLPSEVSRSPQRSINFPNTSSLIIVSFMNFKWSKSRTVEDVTGEGLRFFWVLVVWYMVVFIFFVGSAVLAVSFMAASMFSVRWISFIYNYLYYGLPYISSSSLSS